MNENEENGNEESRIQRIKKHIRENRKVYIGTGAGVVVGVVVGVLVHKKYGTLKPQVIVSQVANNRCKIRKQTISIYGNKIGRPGIRVYDWFEGKLYKYESIALASDATGVSRAHIDGQLRGKIAHTNGHHFVR